MNITFLSSFNPEYINHWSGSTRQNKEYEVLAEQTEQTLIDSVDLLLYVLEWTK
ncbi:MAG: hypothetical protein VB024_06590 [Dysgonamonadaceae bacterium]|jgi:hypothetical protein|nr:hypothetical protein [Dysgonamonadaceae bacterium]